MVAVVVNVLQAHDGLLMRTLDRDRFFLYYWSWVGVNTLILFGEERLYTTTTGALLIFYISELVICGRAAAQLQGLTIGSFISTISFTFSTSFRNVMVEGARTPLDCFFFDYSPLFDVLQDLSNRPVTEYEEQQPLNGY